MNDDFDFEPPDFDPWSSRVAEDQTDETEPSIASGTAQEIRIIPPATDPGRVADAYLGYLPYPLRNWRDDWYRWTGSHWTNIPDKELRAALNAWLTASSCFDKDGLAVPWNPTKKKRDEVIDTLSLHPGVFLSDSVREETAGIPFRNGVLGLDGRLRPHNPVEMRTWCVDADYADTAECPLWFGFLADALDADQVDLAQEWAGYVLAGDTRAHKVMLAHGAPRAGKGTYSRVLGSLVGSGAGATQPDRMLANFGLEPLLSAQLVTIGDVRWSDRSSRKMLDLIRAISGGDPVQVDRKFKPGLKDVYLPGRFLFTSNDMPSFGDDSGATLSRFLLLGFVKSHVGHEDHELLSKLLGELPGIARWAIAGYRRLVSNHLHFTEPVRARADRDDLRLDVEPVATWAGERLEYDERSWVPVADLYDDFREWRGVKDEDDAGRSWFGRKVKAAKPCIRGERQYVNRPRDPFEPSQGTKRVRERGFSGIKLINEGEERTTEPKLDSHQSTLDA
jgi:putative DNA primase/helicase